MADDSIAGKRALVTGASRGIGRATALALAQAGADVALAARGTDELNQVAAEIVALGRKAAVIACDVTGAAQVQQMVESARAQLGGIDILVNNAGSAQSAKFLGHPDELWHRLLAMNLTSVYYVTKAVAPVMVAQHWGRIITIASIAGKVASRYTTAYTASKHGVLGLMKSVALELATTGVTVNSICPGYVDTPMTDATVTNMVSRTGMSEAEARAFLANTSPQKRLVTPEEVARMVVFLAQEGSGGITGQAINIDGGSVMG
ncbi:MAG TPA: SDR family NAD(P)-dependent oxidoreductase [Ktedonobacterales bacterium]|nr:SDR family NAD(P)-dependent oxidoreductase [Ktedonobacterales bacterium]